MAPLTYHSLLELKYGLLHIGVNINEEKEFEHVIQFKDFENLNSTGLSLLEGFRMNFKNFGIMKNIYILTVNGIVQQKIQPGGMHNVTHLDNLGNLFSEES